MSADAISEETSRLALGALLTSTMTGSGKPVQAVFANWVSDFSGDDELVSAPSPVVMLQFGGVARQKAGLGTKQYRSYFRILVWLFVADAKGAEGWTDADVDAAFADIEKLLADVLMDNESTAAWEHIRYENLTTPGEVPVPTNVGGKPYVRMRIPVIIQVKDG